MQYWEIVTRSFRISWRHKYLWLVALFSGEAGGGANFSYNQGLPSNTGKGGNASNFSDAAGSTGQWLNGHIGLIVFVAVVALLIAIGFFILAAVCEGATVRGSAEHDAERPFGLGWAWQAGLKTMGSIIRLRLLIIALLLPGLIILAMVLVGFFAALASGAGAAAAALGVLLALVILAFIPYAIYIGFLDRLGSRAVVLELIGARAALSRGHRLVRTRLGRVLLVWLLSIAVGIALGIVVAIALIAVAIPVIVGGIFAATTGSGFAVVLAVIGVLILIPVALVVSGFVSAQASTYWTLAFRRLELDQVPAAGYPYPYPTPPQPGLAPPPQGAPPA